MSQSHILRRTIDVDNKFDIDLSSLNSGNVEVFSVDVCRLRSEGGPIEYGDAAMFVAVAKFRLGGVNKGLPAGARLLEIRDDADWISLLDDGDVIKRRDGEVAIPANTEREPDANVGPHADVVEEWLKRHWEFRFYVNDQRMEQDPNDPPWVLRVDTSMVVADYLRVEVDIVGVEDGTADPDNESGAFNELPEELSVSLAFLASDSVERGPVGYLKMRKQPDQNAQEFWVKMIIKERDGLLVATTGTAEQKADAKGVRRR